jgi:uncharacterized membrane protein
MLPFSRLELNDQPPKFSILPIIPPSFASSLMFSLSLLLSLSLLFLVVIVPSCYYLSHYQIANNRRVSAMPPVTVAARITIVSLVAKASVC